MDWLDLDTETGVRSIETITAKVELVLYNQDLGSKYCFQFIEDYYA